MAKHLVQTLDRPLHAFSCATQTYLVAGVESIGATESFWDLWVGPLSMEAEKLRETLMGRPINIVLSNHACHMS